MQVFEFECSHCKKITIVELSDSKSDIPNIEECAHCGEDFLKLVRYDKDNHSMLISIKEDLRALNERLENVEEEISSDDLILPN